MSNRASSTGRLKGVYLRGKKYWYRYTHEGRQYRVPLDTEDEGEAIAKALRIRKTRSSPEPTPLGRTRRLLGGDARERHLHS